MIRHLFVPGLLGPMSGIGREERRGLPHLEMLLARADRLVEPTGFAEGLFRLFGIEVPAGAELPTAAVCYLADTGEAPTEFLLHADPLQLLPDRDRLLAFDLDDDPPDADEIAALVETFNSYFSADGVRLGGTPAGRLYLHCDQAPSIRTYPLPEVIGRNLDHCLPAGEDQRRWRGLLNETQMLCHTLDFNSEREMQGRPMLGGLWFSGGGCLPSGGQGAVSQLAGDSVLARGLLALSPGQGADELLVEQAPGKAVMHADPQGWLQAIVGLEARMPELMDGCESLLVHPGNGTVFRWSARCARRFWRRKRSLFDRLDAVSEGVG